MKNHLYRLLKKLGIIRTSMGIRLGNFDPLQLIFNIMNALMKKGQITFDEAREILDGALPPEMPLVERNKILDSMVKRTK